VVLRAWIWFIGFFSKTPWHFICLRCFTIIGGYNRTFQAIRCAKAHNEGLKRKDERDEFIHLYRTIQIFIFHTIIKFPKIVRRYIGHEKLDSIFPAILFHDTPENVSSESFDVIVDYGEDTNLMVWLLTKEAETIQYYFPRIEECVWTILIKFADRLHNLRNMTKNLHSARFFSPKRLSNQIKETWEEIIPLTEAAVKCAPELEPIIKDMYKALLDALVEAEFALWLDDQEKR
jgi:hypothetical protein